MISLNWENIDTVLLDMDGTLLDLHFDNFFWLHHLPKRYAEENNTSVDLVIDNLQRLMRENQGTLNCIAPISGPENSIWISLNSNMK